MREIFKMCEENKECEVDAAEYTISLYVEDMERFINEYGFEKEIISIKDNDTISDIEIKLLKFLKYNSKGLDFMEILGTLKGLDSIVYVCCYEPYGDEVFCVEYKNDGLYFYDTKEYAHGIKMQHIDYIEKSY